MHRVSEIKLIRTDTTLDLSQKAEKVWLRTAFLDTQPLCSFPFRSHGGQDFKIQIQKYIFKF
jgi:hypothetical protein